MFETKNKHCNKIVSLFYLSFNWPSELWSNRRWNRTKRLMFNMLPVGRALSIMVLMSDTLSGLSCLCF